MVEINVLTYFVLGCICILFGCSILAVAGTFSFFLMKGQAVAQNRFKIFSIFFVLSILTVTLIFTLYPG